MKSSRITITTTSMTILCMLSLFGGSLATTDETSNLLGTRDIATAHFGPLVSARDQFAGGKRAYTYRSEFKRLPLYQFGLGKRWVAPGIDNKRSQPFSFGLGKRTKMQYSFGLGKRSSYEDPNYAYADLPNDYEFYEQRDGYDNYLPSKRGSSFGNFGLGKRDTEATDNDMRDDGIFERLPAKNLRDKYLFGLGKRFYNDEIDDA